MREILFRGKRIDNREWVYGLLLETPIREYREYGSNFYIVRGYAEHNDDGWHFLSYLVDEQTISQYTGLTDKNGKKIFEGDIMPVWEQGEEYNYKVIYNGDCFMLSMLDSEQGSYPLSTKNVMSEVIGNIHDNPELLKGGG